MQRLLAGYARFRSHVFPTHKNLFEQLSKGQQPEALFITCSDSRVMPELILQCEPGQIFPIRMAGNLVPPPGPESSGISATIEYAVRALKVKDIILCGHSGCGAMKELLEQAHPEALPDTTSWLHHAGPSSKWLRSTLRDVKTLSTEQQLSLLVEANVIAQVEHLRQHDAVREGLRKDTVRLHGWIYDIHSGEIRAFDPAAGVFHPLPHAEPQLVEKRIA